MILESSYSLLNQIGVLTLSLLVELGDFVHFIKFFYSVVVLSPKIYHPALKKTVFYFWLVPLIATRIGCRKQMCWAVSPTLACFLGFIVHHQSLFCSYYCGGCLSELAELISLLILVGSQLVIAINHHYY